MHDYCPHDEWPAAAAWQAAWLPEERPPPHHHLATPPYAAAPSSLSASGAAAASSLSASGGGGGSSGGSVSGSSVSGGSVGGCSSGGGSVSGGSAGGGSAGGGSVGGGSAGGGVISSSGDHLLLLLPPGAAIMPLRLLLARFREVEFVKSELPCCLVPGEPKQQRSQAVRCVGSGPRPLFRLQVNCIWRGKASFTHQARAASSA